MRSYSSREVIAILQRNGWRLTRIRGDHHQFEHDFISGTVTVPHPKKDINIRTLNSILKQTGIKMP